MHVMSFVLNKNSRHDIIVLSTLAWQVYYVPSYVGKVEYA